MASNFIRRGHTGALTSLEHQLITIDDVGAVAAFLVSDAARHMIATIIPMDAGQQVVACMGVPHTPPGHATVMRASRV